jgi:hypothetical protein
MNTRGLGFVLTGLLGSISLAEESSPDLQQPREPDGDGAVVIDGELKTWHTVTLTMDGFYAHELDNKRSPFLDLHSSAVFTHESGEPEIQVRGYFAADGNAAETSAQSGTQWRVHFTPPKPGKWNFQFSLTEMARHPDTGRPYDPKGGLLSVVMDRLKADGTFEIQNTDKTLPDFRARGCLSYVGKPLLQFEGDKSYFLKAGADAPETLLAFEDFDGTKALNPKKGPLKTWQPHVRDWKEGDPTWQDGKGKGLIGALNYLSGKGCNAFSFLTYNVDGDGDNVWPFVAPREKFHYDCSKLDQWGKVFKHATTRGLFLHFKLQETENDDHNVGHGGDKTAEIEGVFDEGNLGLERKLYCRELVARFGHHLALNWNIGEENTQTTEQQLAMAKYIRKLDPYNHPIVIHSYPDQQDRVYRPLLGKEPMTGASLQNSNLKDCHHQVVKWLELARESGHPWTVSFDEPGNAQLGMPPDPDWPGMGDYGGPSIHDCRKYALWGTLMAGGMGVEYYFGYQLPENDLRAEDWRSRDQSWDYCRIALEFFRKEDLPLVEMANRDDLVGNPQHDNSRYCLAKEGEAYLVYLPTGGECEFPTPEGEFSLTWFNRRTGEKRAQEEVTPTLRAPDQEDWLAVIRADD